MRPGTAEVIPAHIRMHQGAPLQKSMADFLVDLLADLRAAIMSLLAPGVIM